MKCLLKENGDLKEENLKLTFEISKLKKDLAKLKDDKFTDYLGLIRERDARYTLYFENVALQLKLKELDGSSSQANQVDDAYEDPVVLRIALDRCREQLSSTQRQLKNMTDEYADTVPRREHDLLEARHGELGKKLDALTAELDALQTSHRRLIAQKKSLEEELRECKEKCMELERAGTPRPHWETCADFIGGGRDRWWQLASGMSSRDKLRVLLKELGPAAESEHLEHFDGLGTDPSVPPYLRAAGRVRNLRLSRREVCVVLHDVWRARARQRQRARPALQDFLAAYFEERYQQASVRAEWAYNVCAGVEQMLDEPHVKLFWGVLHGHLSEDIYWSHRDQCSALKDQLYKMSKDGENEEGFDRVELARELYRQRQLAQDKYIREVVAALGARAAARAVSVEQLKRAFAIVDPAINHIRMERYIRWAFSDQTSELSSIAPLPLRTIAARLAAGDIERVGPRYRGTRRR
ncbi:translin-associated factor X-interacting protein 1-like isoform X1 [Epargyreus clarus]|uniref:translin-associated factor X-interacting protein 1-like isoform X1 n=1 Tax=Epargyreus clarus TaxID=520877 RepID=UPI003C2EAFF9